jgi:acetoin utilization deacetylase AcuC-like enzyme
MEELVYFYPDGHEAHFESGHPERPERVETIKESLVESGLWESFPKLDPYRIQDEVILEIHDERYLKNLQRICERGQHYDMDTYTTPASWQLALNAAGGAIAVVDHVWSREAKRGFAITRPPGHHATRNRAMGFCLLNNVAIAAEYLIKTKDLNRLAIIDIDLHHGNGTQDIFYQRDDVFYISTHQYPHYPGTGEMNETGRGSGRGTTANIPMPPMSGDSAFITSVAEIIIPLLDRYNPEMIVVSYGFDAHFRDPLGYLLLTTDGYHQIISSLSRWADTNCYGRLALLLEGGYDLEAARSCSRSVVEALLGESGPELFENSPTPEGENWKLIIQQVKNVWGI